MRILMLSDFYPPIIGGMERYVKTLSEGLSEKGHSVTVCTIKNNHLPNFEEQNGVRIKRIEGFFQRMPFLYANPRRKYHPPIQDWLITRKLEKIVAETRPDIIHAHGWILYSVLPIRKKNNIPLIVTLHDYGFICPKKSTATHDEVISSERCYKSFSMNCVSCGLNMYGFAKSFLAYSGIRLNKNTLRLVDKFISVSRYVKEIYSGYLNEEKIVVIPNFYDDRENRSVERLKEREMLPADFILFVGFLVPLKGVNVLRKAFSMMKTKTKLVLIGTTHPKYHYKTEGNVIVIKDAPHDIVLKACGRCKFLVIPSITPEACPTIAFEAMSHKKAIIASDVGGLKEIVINGKTGILTQPGDSKMLANSMHLLLENPEKNNEMGRNGYWLFRKRFSLNSILPKIENLYEESAFIAEKK
jgi:glycosyltransferase involved in cell wall biosynthesis